MAQLANAVDPGAPVDLTGTCWRDDLWLQTYGLLSPATALDYFANSPFYDRTSNNEAARRRGMRLEQIPATPGVEFLLQDAQPPHLFVIKKQYRQVDGSVTSVAFFYILDGTVYQAPTLHAALRSRIDRCMFTVRSAFSELRKDLDPLGSAATELRGAEAVAALKQQEATPAAITSLKVREQQQKAERNLLSTLLSYPLPVAASVVAAAQEANEEKEGLADAELSPPGHLSAGALSVP